MRKLAMLAFLAVCAAPMTASADTLPDIYAGLLGGYTASTDKPDGALEPMGVALGARAGLTIPTTSIYVGGLFLYHLGDSESVAGADISASSFMLGAEGGYEFGFGPLVLRPSLGLGLHSASIDGVVDTGFGTAKADSSESSFYLSPGLNFMVKLGLLLGAEVRYNAIFNDNISDSVSILGTVGVAI